MLSKLIICSISPINKPVYETVLSDRSKSLVLCTGPAGTGKTMLACKHSMLHFKNKTYNKIIITRPNVSVDEDLGYLPGDMDSKMYPWLIPLFDHMEKYSNKATLLKLLKTGDIEIAPLGFLRGRTFDNTLIIADEMQNATDNQMMTLLTRIGVDTKMIITGDLEQCDLSNNTSKKNGLQIFINKLKQSKNNYEDISLVEFSDSDIRRSEIVKSILEIYKEEDI